MFVESWSVFVNYKGVATNQIDFIESGRISKIVSTILVLYLASKNF